MEAHDFEEVLLDSDYVDIVDLHQFYLRDLQQLREELLAAKPKPTASSYDKWLGSYAKLGRLLAAAVKEGRMLEASRLEDDLSNEELMERLTPLLLTKGWRPPQTQAEKAADIMKELENV